MSEMEADAETSSFSNRISSVVSKLTEAEGLVKAFDGCAGVFHTTAFVDPAGISGYSVNVSISSTSLCTCICHMRVFVYVYSKDTRGTGMYRTSSITTFKFKPLSHGMPFIEF